MAGGRGEAHNVPAQRWGCDISREVVNDGRAIRRFKYLEVGELRLARSVIGENAQFEEFRFRRRQLDQLFGPGFLTTRLRYFREPSVALVVETQTSTCFGASRSFSRSM